MAETLSQPRMLQNNAALATIFHRMADCYGYLGTQERFRTIAYENVSKILHNMKEDIAQYATDLKTLDDIGDIGESIVVFPGAINSNIMKNSGLDAPKSSTENKSMKIWSSAKAAQIIIDGMERNQYRVLVGKDATFMDLLYRLKPRNAAKLIYSKM